MTQTTPGVKDGASTVLTAGINTPYYRFAGKQIQKSKFPVDFFCASRQHRSESNQPMCPKDHTRTMKVKASPVNSEISVVHASHTARLPGWLKLTAIAAASALGGGLAAAFFYRNALKRLQNAESESENPDFGRPRRLKIDPD